MTTAADLKIGDVVRFDTGVCYLVDALAVGEHVGVHFDGGFSLALDPDETVDVLT